MSDDDVWNIETCSETEKRCCVFKNIYNTWAIKTLSGIACSYLFVLMAYFFFFETY